MPERPSDGVSDALCEERRGHICAALKKGIEHLDKQRTEDLAYLEDSRRESIAGLEATLERHSKDLRCIVGKGAEATTRAHTRLDVMGGEVAAVAERSTTNQRGIRDINQERAAADTAPHAPVQERRQLPIWAQVLIAVISPLLTAALLGGLYAWFSQGGF